MNLDKKIDYSIALLRKAESMALRLDPENGFYLAFSGGKDSQALYHIAQMAGVIFKQVKRMMKEAILLTALNIFWGWVWFNVGKYIGRKEKK